MQEGYRTSCFAGSYITYKLLYTIHLTFYTIYYIHHIGILMFMWSFRALFFSQADDACQEWRGALDAYACSSAYGAVILRDRAAHTASLF